MLRPDHSLRPLLKIAAALAALGLVVMEAGCGWTPRDEYLHARKVTLSSSPGDRSTVAFTPDPMVDDLVANPSSVASVPDEP